MAQQPLNSGGGTAGRIAARLTDAQRRTLFEVAGRRGITVSDVIRLLIDALERGIDLPELKRTGAGPPGGG